MYDGCSIVKVVFSHFFMAKLQGIRDEDPNETIDVAQLRNQAKMEAQLLFEPISEKLSASQFSSTFVLMFSNPSHLQLRYTFREFEKIVKMETEAVISRFVTDRVSYPLLSLGEFLIIFYCSSQTMQKTIRAWRPRQFRKKNVLEMAVIWLIGWLVDWVYLNCHGTDKLIAWLGILEMPRDWLIDCLISTSTKNY